MNAPDSIRIITATEGVWDEWGYPVSLLAHEDGSIYVNAAEYAQWLIGLSVRLADRGDDNAETPAGARSKVLPRNGVGEYVLSVKRTTNEEMARATFADFHH